MIINFNTISKLSENRNTDEEERCKIQRKIIKKKHTQTKIELLSLLWLLLVETEEEFYHKTKSCIIC